MCFPAGKKINWIFFFVLMPHFLNAILEANQEVAAQHASSFLMVIYCKIARSNFLKSPEVSDRTASVNDFLYFSWNFPFIAGRSLWEDTKSLFRRVGHVLYHVPCSYQDPWGLIQGPLQPVGEEEKAGGPNTLEDPGVLVRTWGKLMWGGVVRGH